MLPPSLIKQTGEKSEAEGPQLGVARVRLTKPGQDATQTTEDQQAALGSKECFTIQTHHVKQGTASCTPTSERVLGGVVDNYVRQDT